MGVKTNIKTKIKAIIGTKNVSRLKIVKSHVNHIKNHSNWSKLSIDCSDWELERIIKINNKHVFFGYYDIQQLNKKQDKALIHVLDRKAVAGKSPICIKWVDLKNGNIHDITTSMAWSWQQGCRLRWHPLLEDTVILNNCVDGKYVTEVWSIKNNKSTLLNRYPVAFYDIDSNFQYGISVNFSRLQRLRPGYGYTNLQDNTMNEFVPVNDGIWRYDFETGKNKLLYSLKDLVDLTPEAKGKWNYVNHVSFAPDGKQFMFFHIWTEGPESRWKLKLYISDIHGKELQCIEEEQITSHYCWRNNDELLTTTVGFGGTRSYYNMYVISNLEKKVIDSGNLLYDGHPSYLPDKEQFISDTYPLDGGMQQLFSINRNGSEYKRICTIYSDDRYFGEKRCDLHPRVTEDGQRISIDSNCSGVRSVYLLKRKLTNTN